VRAVVLAGSYDHGLCPLTSALPRGLWPLVDRPVVQHVVERLVEQGLRDVAVCANGHSHLFAEVCSGWPLDEGSLRFYEDHMPRGAAGCVADVAGNWRGESFVVVQANVVFSKSLLAEILAVHGSNGADITVGLRHAGGNGHLAPAGIYVLEPRVLDFVSPRSYQDLKEQVIPALVKAGGRVVPFIVKGGYLSWHDAASYLRAVGAALSDPGGFGLSLEWLGEVAPSVFVADDVEIDRTARLFGPLALLDGARIGAGAVLVGPAVVGYGSHVGRKAVLADSVLWDRVQVGDGASVGNSVVGGGVYVRPGAVLNRAAVPPVEPVSWPAGKRSDVLRGQRGQQEDHRVTTY
jgi:NDP-sugar pyrophosphorylase family protein